MSEHYGPACADPDCPAAYAYRDPFPEVPHYHARPHGPEKPPADPPSPDHLRRLALQLRTEHDGRTQADVLASIDPHPRCSICHYTRHPCAVFELADDVVAFLGAPEGEYVPEALPDEVYVGHRRRWWRR